MNKESKCLSGMLVIVLFLALSPSVHASTAYGSINNFDTVNDTGVPCHGFEIEIEDAHSTDVTYTYDWNHYGVPRITEDNSNPAHPKVIVRYESKKNLDGSWAAYTAVPSGPVAPTDGHQFTDPSVNFGGEHFGVGFYGNPTSVKYNWLIDDGSGSLVHGGVVNISTPTFTYIDPGNGGAAQVQAAIVPPPPPAPPVMEFGEASWVKETRTESHNNEKVELRDLVSDDPEDPNDRNWRNGEPDEVEVEWQILQTEFKNVDGGANGELQGAPEELKNGDEIVTRRYDFYKYVGPIDEETGEALAEKVGPDGIHGVEDYADVVIVGDYIGAQMAGFDAAGQIGLIDHVQDGEINVQYVDRTIVVGGTYPIVTTSSGDLPNGMLFDEVTGVLSGTPTESGTFTFEVVSTDAAGGNVSKTYHLAVVDSGVVEEPHVVVTTIALPQDAGNVIGGDEYLVGADVTVEAIANAGFEFANWTDGGTIVSESAVYQFTTEVNRQLVAHFVPVALEGQPAEGQPAEGQPAEGQPAEGQPVEGQPVEGQPVEGQPVEGQPAEGQPAEGQPVEGQPVEGEDLIEGEDSPEGEDLSEGESLEGAPAEGAPAEGAPAEGAPAEGAPAEGAPAEGESIEGAPAEGAPAEGAPAEGQSAADGEAVSVEGQTSIPNAQIVVQGCFGA